MIPVEKSANIRIPKLRRIVRLPRAAGGFSDVQETRASGEQLPLTLESLHAHTRSHYAAYRLIGGRDVGEGGPGRERISPAMGLSQPSSITRIETNGRVVAGTLSTIKGGCTRVGGVLHVSTESVLQKCTYGCAAPISDATAWNRYER